MAFRLPARYHVKVRVYNEEIDFGKGVAELLRLTGSTGSLSAACREMGMASSKAWKIIRRAEADLGIRLLEGCSGGRCGGGSKLTEAGRLLLERYTAFDRDVQQAAAHAFARHFGAGEGASRSPEKV